MANRLDRSRNVIIIILWSRLRTHAHRTCSGHKSYGCLEWIRIDRTRIRRCLPWISAAPFWYYVRDDKISTIVPFSLMESKKSLLAVFSFPREVSHLYGNSERWHQNVCELDKVHKGSIDLLLTCCIGKDKLKTGIFTAEVTDVAVAIISSRHMDDVVIDSHKDLYCRMFFEMTLTDDLRRFTSSACITFNCHRCIYEYDLSQNSVWKMLQNIWSRVAHSIMP